MLGPWIKESGQIFLIALLLLHPVVSELWFCCHLFLHFLFVCLFVFPLWFLQWPLGYLATWFNLFVFVSFWFSFCLFVCLFVFSVEMLRSVKKNIWYNFNFPKFTKAWFVLQEVIYSSECFMCTWEKSIFCHFWIEYPIDSN